MPRYSRGYVVYNAAQATRIDIKNRERELLEVGRDIPSQDEINTILTGVSEHWRPLLVSAAFTGMRASELRGLPWDAVDFENRIIRVRQRADHWGTLGPPKTAAGRREIPMRGPSSRCCGSGVWPTRSAGTASCSAR